jgi:hypothetical protein
VKSILSLKRFYQLIHTLSFDVAVGSVMTGIFACNVLSVEINYWWLTIIALVVWVMYTADHLLDAWKRKKEISIKRHLFHFNHLKIILPFWVLAVIASVILSITKLSSEIVFIGFFIGIGILIYFTAIYFTGDNKPTILQKELTIALIYVGGIWMAPIVWYGDNPDGIIWMIMTNLALMAWAEGIIVSWYEFKEDATDKHISFSIIFGKNNSRRFIYFLLSAVILFSVTGMLMNIHHTTFLFAFSIELVMSFILFVLILFPGLFRENEIYRYVGEVTFILQGFILFV